MKYYSFAGAARGKTDPEETHIYNVGGSDCDIEGCVDANCDHTVIMWSGNEYSKNSSWIAAPDDFTINLENAR